MRRRDYADTLWNECSVLRRLSVCGSGGSPPKRSPPVLRRAGQRPRIARESAPYPPRGHTTRRRAPLFPRQRRSDSRSVRLATDSTDRCGQSSLGGPPAAASITHQLKDTDESGQDRTGDNNRPDQHEQKRSPQPYCLDVAQTHRGGPRGSGNRHHRYEMSTKRQRAEGGAWCRALLRRSSHLRRVAFTGMSTAIFAGSRIHLPTTSLRGIARTHHRYEMSTKREGRYTRIRMLPDELPSQSIPGGGGSIV